MFRNFVFAILAVIEPLFIVSLCTAAFQDSPEIQTVSQLKAKLENYAKKALSNTVDGSLNDWDGFPVFDSRTNDGCIDAKIISSVRFAPLPDRLVAAVNIDGAVPDGTDLIVDIDLWGQMQVDLRLTIPLRDTAKSTVALNTSESWYSDDSPLSKAFETNALIVSASEDGIVEFSLAYRELRKLITDQFELKKTFGKRKGALPNSANARNWVRISPSLRKKDAGIVDRGVACACWILSDKTVLPETQPADGVMYLDVPFDDQWYIGQAGFGVGSHAQLNAYDIYETDRWLHPSRIWRTPKNEDYFSWKKPIYAPAPGRIKFQRGDVTDSPSFAPNKERSNSDNRVAVEAEENGALISLLHFAKDSVEIQLGDQVSPSKVIAKTGNSGQTGWPHLHVECRVPPKLSGYIDAVPLGFKHVCVSLNNDIDDPWRGDLPYWEIKEGFFVCPSAAITQTAMQSRRLWQDRSGRFKVDAQVSEYDDEKVKLRKADGTTVTVPISKLSFEDQTLVRYALRRRLPSSETTQANVDASTEK